MSTLKMNMALMNVAIVNGVLVTSVWRATGGIKIFSGTMPTRSDLNTSTTATNAYRSSDLLLTSPGLNVTTITNHIWNAHAANLYMTASASGTASWFMFSPNSADLIKDREVAVGTVTGPGGGGDVIVDNVNIISGQTYFIKEWNIQFSTLSWTF